MLSGKRTISLYYNYFSTYTNGWALCNQITEGLWIGILPTRHAPIKEAIDMDDKIIKQISLTTPDRPLKLVISVVEENELMGKGFAGITTIKPDDWKQKDIDHHLLEMVDFTADVSPLETIKAVLKIKKCICDGASVYVHCKAGRARSAMLCAIYLSSFCINPDTANVYTLDEAESLLVSQRQQINLSKSKKATAAMMIMHINQMKLPALLAGERTWDSIADLVPTEWKDDLNTFLKTQILINKEQPAQADNDEKQLDEKKNQQYNC